MGMSQQSVTLLVADLLDLEYRHPLLTAGPPWLGALWQARQDRGESLCRWVSARRPASWTLRSPLAASLLRRAMKLVEGLIAAIDPAAEERADDMPADSSGSMATDGVSWLEGRINTTDARLFDSVLSEIAAILKANGDTDDRELRRRAPGILATPWRG